MARRRWPLTLVALLMLLPAGGVAVAHSHLLSAGAQGEPGPPEITGLPPQPVAPHGPPADLTPAARVDPQARRAAAGGHNQNRPLPDGYTPTPEAGRLVPATPTSTATVLATPVAVSYASTPPPTDPSATPPPLPTSTAARTATGTPLPAPPRSATPTPHPATVATPGVH